MLPVFLSRADLVKAWVVSGRRREDVPDNLTVMDLRVLVRQMQTDQFAWSTVQFVGSEAAVELVKEAKEVADDEPPPLEAHVPEGTPDPADAPPPLEQA